MNKVIFILLFFTESVFGTIIPTENRINWTPGIPGGIPTITSPLVNVVTDFSADNTGVVDAGPAIRNAINSLSSGGVVYLPAGTYKIVGSIKIGKNNIVLRGDSPKDTKLLFENIAYWGACISIITYGRGDWQSVSGYTKDATTLTVDDGSKFSVGQFVEIQQENDSAFMYTKPEWNQPWAQNLVGQFMEVTEINGNQIIFRTPLHITYQAKFNPVVRPQRLVTKVGVEDLYIELTTKNESSIIFFKNAAYGWVKNVETYHTLLDHVGAESSLACEVRDSYLHRSWDYGGGGHGYGVSCGYHVTDWLIENNIFDSTRHAMIVSLGANGNVFAYNYSQNVLQGNGETNLNQGWYPPDISSHGHYPYMNLFEENSVNRLSVSDYWGPPGPGNTYFRNRVLSKETNDGITSDDYTTKQNILGNSAISRTDYGTFTDNIEHGNTIDGTLIWDSSIDDHNLPSSYYLTEKPDFFGELPWPLYGPDEGYADKLPAQIRFEEDEMTDTESPTIPSNLTSSNVTASSVDLLWDASTDNVGVTGYDVYQDGLLVSSVTDTSTTISGLAASTTYVFKVLAKDATGNESPKSKELTIKTHTATGVDNELELAISIYPNPVSENLNIIIGRNIDVTVQIIDVNGNQVKMVRGNKESYCIDMKNFKSGIYFVRIVTSDKVHLEKIIKK